MGVDTKAILTDAPSIIELLYWADENYRKASISSSSGVDENFFYLNFKDGEDQRNIAVFVNNSVAGDYSNFYKGDATFVSMRMWGNSERIVRKLVHDFGGWFMVNDCEDEWKRLDQF